MATNLEILIQTCVELGSAKTLETLGLSAGEISQGTATAIYGKYFQDADRAGRIRPCSIESGTRCSQGRTEITIKSLYTMKAIKSIIKGILAIGMITGFILATGECETFQAVWSLLWIAEATFCGWALFKLVPEDFKQEDRV